MTWFCMAFESLDHTKMMSQKHKAGDIPQLVIVFVGSMGKGIKTEGTSEKAATDATSLYHF